MENQVEKLEKAPDNQQLLRDVARAIKHFSEKMLDMLGTQKSGKSQLQLEVEEIREVKEELMGQPDHENSAAISSFGMPELLDINEITSKEEEETEELMEQPDHENSAAISSFGMHELLNMDEITCKEEEELVEIPDRDCSAAMCAFELPKLLNINEIFYKEEEENEEFMEQPDHDNSAAMHPFGMPEHLKINEITDREEEENLLEKKTELETQVEELQNQLNKEKIECKQLELELTKTKNEKSVPNHEVVRFGKQIKQMKEKLTEQDIELEEAREEVCNLEKALLSKVPEVHVKEEGYCAQELAEGDKMVDEVNGKSESSGRDLLKMQVTLDENQELIEAFKASLASKDEDIVGLLSKLADTESALLECQKKIKIHGMPGTSKQMLQIEKDALKRTPTTSCNHGHRMTEVSHGSGSNHTKRTQNPSMAPLPGKGHDTHNETLKNLKKEVEKWKKVAKDAKKETGKALTEVQLKAEIVKDKTREVEKRAGAMKAIKLHSEELEREIRELAEYHKKRDEVNSIWEDGERDFVGINKSLCEKEGQMETLKSLLASKDEAIAVLNSKLADTESAFKECKKKMKVDRMPGTSKEMIQLGKDVSKRKPTPSRNHDHGTTEVAHGGGSNAIKRPSMAPLPEESLDVGRLLEENKKWKKKTMDAKEEAKKAWEEVKLKDELVEKRATEEENMRHEFQAIKIRSKELERKVEELAKQDKMRDEGKSKLETKEKVWIKVKKSLGENQKQIEGLRASLGSKDKAVAGLRSKFADTGSALQESQKKMKVDGTPRTSKAMIQSEKDILKRKPTTFRNHGHGTIGVSPSRDLNHTKRPGTAHPSGKGIDVEKVSIMKLQDEVQKWKRKDHGVEKEAEKAMKKVQLTEEFVKNKATEEEKMNCATQTITRKTKKPEGEVQVLTEHDKMIDEANSKLEAETKILVEVKTSIYDKQKQIEALRDELKLKDKAISGLHLKLADTESAVQNYQKKIKEDGVPWTSKEMIQSDKNVLKRKPTTYRNHSHGSGSNPIKRPGTAPIPGKGLDVDKEALINLQKEVEKWKKVAKKAMKEVQLKEDIVKEKAAEEQRMKRKLQATILHSKELERELKRVHINARGHISRKYSPKSVMLGDIPLRSLRTGRTKESSIPLKFNPRGKECNKKNDLLKHSVVKHILKPFKCLTPGKGFNKKCNLASHAIIHKGSKPFRCATCGKDFSRKGNLAIHTNIHCSLKSFICLTCGKVFNFRRSLAAHSLTHNGLKTYKCDTCGKYFCRKGDLASHVVIHTGLKPFKCDTCGKYFCRKSGLASHVVTHTGLKPFKCETCGKGFRQKSNLATHATTHTGLKPFKCMTCGKGFNWKFSLYNHSLTHSGLNPYQCETCGKDFCSKYSLATHTIIHTGLKPFKCETCGKHFCRKGDLATHTITHALVKPFKCETCGKEFNKKWNLSTHLPVHSRWKLYICETCGKEFHRKGFLSRHLAKHCGL